MAVSRNRVRERLRLKLREKAMTARETGIERRKRILEEERIGGIGAQTAATVAVKSGRNNREGEREKCWFRAQRGREL